MVLTYEVITLYDNGKEKECKIFSNHPHAEEYFDKVKHGEYSYYLVKCLNADRKVLRSQ